MRLYSMTGFGRGVYQKDGREMTVELKSVNHRFLDLSFRIPRSLSFMEDLIRKYLQKQFSRGHLDVFLTYKNEREDAREAVIDKATVNAYIRASKDISGQGVCGELTISDILRIPDCVRMSEKDEDQQALEELLYSSLAIATEQMKRSRFEEGERLKEDVRFRLSLILSRHAEIAKREPLVVSEYQSKLHQRLDQLLGGAELDEARLMQEVAVFADKASIAEELTRLAAHVEAIRTAMETDEPVGRRLDFLVQELNREANTIGSKASDMDIISNVVDIKAEIEKIREQVQNIQ